jgi:hypothetical protein
VLDRQYLGRGIPRQHEFTPVATKHQRESKRHTESRWDS